MPSFSFATTARPARLRAAIAGLVLLGVGMSAQAGGDIRAPFTHIGVGHNGVGVNAPFTNVRVGRHANQHGNRYRDHRRQNDRRRFSHRNDQDRGHGYHGRYDRRNHRQAARYDRYDRHDRRGDHRYAGRRDNHSFFGRW